MSGVVTPFSNRLNRSIYSIFKLFGILINGDIDFIDGDLGMILSEALVVPLVRPPLLASLVPADIDNSIWPRSSLSDLLWFFFSHLSF